MKKNTGLESIAGIAAGLIILSLIFKVKILVTIALIVLLIGLLSPWLTQKISWLWIKFAGLLGMTNSKIILTCVFFLVLTPIAFLSKVFGKKNPAFSRQKNKTTFTERNHTYTAKDFENTW